MCQCSLPTYLPVYNDLNVSVKGAKINLVLNKGFDSGELIAVDSTELYILNQNNQLIKYKLNSIKNYKVFYATPKKIGWVIPMITLLCISHGYYGILTGPATLIISSVIVNPKLVYRYTKLNLSPQQLSLYARFPQGIPARLKHSDIR